MSDTDTDPVISHLRERRAELVAVLADTGARLNEVENLLAQLNDGRTRVRRKLREVPTPPEAPPGDAA